MAQWQSELLKDIRAVPKVGSPGRMVVFGEQAEPIIAGNDGEDIIFAAAEYGSGRIVVFSQDGYALNAFSETPVENPELVQLHRNMKSWLTRGSELEVIAVLNLNDAEATVEKLQGVKIAYWYGGSKEFVPQGAILEFLRQGGALVHAMTPWGWRLLNENKPLKEMPYWNVLEAIGIIYTDGIVSDNDSEYVVSDNKASNGHLARFLSKFSENPIEILEHSALIRDLKCVPKESGGYIAVQTFLDAAWAFCTEWIQQCIPTRLNHIKTPEGLGVLEMWKVCVDLQERTDEKAPGCEEFPGDFDNCPPLDCGEMEFNAVREEVFSTGYYAEAGRTFKVAVIGGNENLNWSLLVVAHSDVLISDILKKEVEEEKKEGIRRWPNIQIIKLLEESEFQISTPFGGLIYLQSPSDGTSNIKIRLDDVVLAPQFKLSDGDVEGWKTRRGAPGLWADIIGKYITFTLPSSSIRELEHPTEALNIWDGVITMYHDLRGTNVGEYRRQWVVADEQPSAGYMHAGYPIVTMLDVSNPSHEDFVLNATNLRRKGLWGLFHEIGHNMQSDVWTFDGTIDVTCNIFSLYAMDQLCGLKPWIHTWLRESLQDAIDYLNKDKDFEEWKSKAGIGLFIYAQLMRDFGWEAYRKVFRRYLAMADSDKPSDDQKKMDTWFRLFSEEAGKSVAPFTQFWGIPLSSNAVADMNNLPLYLPDDEITQAAPEKTNYILQLYPGIARNV